MADEVAQVTVTTPSGQKRTLTLDKSEPGVWKAVTPANELGLWRATDGKLTALVNVGPANPREYAEVTSATNVLAPLTQATGGDTRRIADASGNLTIPRILAVRSTDAYKGEDWLGLKMRDASVVRGIGVLPMFAGLLGLLLLIGSLAATWTQGGEVGARLSVRTGSVGAVGRKNQTLLCPALQISAIRTQDRHLHSSGKPDHCE